MEGMSNERYIELGKKRHLTYEEYKEYHGITTPRSLLGEVTHLCKIARSNQQERSRFADMLEILAGFE